MQFLRENYKNICLGGIVLAVVGLFLPFANLSATLNGISASESGNVFQLIEGKMILVFLFLGFVMIISNTNLLDSFAPQLKKLNKMADADTRLKFKQMSRKGGDKYAFIPLFLAIALTVFAILRIKAQNEAYVTLTLGVGFYTIIIGCLIGSAIFFEGIFFNLVNNNMGK